jgi:hypothetical protein
VYILYWEIYGSVLKICSRRGLRTSCEAAPYPELFGRPQPDPEKPFLISTLPAELATGTKRRKGIFKTMQ